MPADKRERLNVKYEWQLPVSKKKPFVCCPFIPLGTTTPATDKVEKRALRRSAIHEKMRFWAAFEAKKCVFC
jgi:hypothetical protein